LRYSIDWSLYEIGRRLNSLERTSYYYNHWLNLTGETPYGNLDSNASIRSLKETTDLTYFSLGLEQGRIGPFKNFTLRTFDYTPPVTNLAFSGVTLRGAMLESPAFNNKIDYTLFGGREGGGRYGNLSPGLAETKDSYISGYDINFHPADKQNYSFSVFHGWGRDRPEDLNPFGYDLDIDYRFDKWSLGSELAFDSETFAHLINANFATEKFKLISEFRNTSESFRTMTGWGWRVGELGLLTNLHYKFTERFNVSGRLDLFKDRLYPNPENEDRWNQDFNFNGVYTIDPLTTLSFDFGLYNELGRVSPYRNYNEGIGLYRTLEFIKKINTFLNYRHQENKYYNSPSSNYINDKISLGLRFNLISNLYYYLNKEFNWVQARYTGTRSKPNVLETGVDWYGQILKSPHYWGNLRFMYRDEENTISPFSFLSGEDYIEGYAELSYRPEPDIEGFLSARVRNVWAENPEVSKRMEVNFYVGMRYLWDTGLRWESVGTVNGYVFKDMNSDGLRQDKEQAVGGVKVWLGKDKSQITDTGGYFEFPKVKAKEVYVTLDANTIPPGFVPTVPVTQKAKIIQGSKTTLYFGITSRSEVYGMVFNDINNNGQPDAGEQGIKGVIIALEDGTQVFTNDSGRYIFRNVSVGEHRLTLEINSLPTQYLPGVSIYKDITLTEGISYQYNIPLRQLQ